MKQVEKYLSVAASAITDLVTEGKITSANAGYISGFAASAIRNGLKTTFLLYYVDDNKKGVLKILAKTIGKEDLVTFKTEISDATKDDLRHYTRKLIDASIAVKIISRTYIID